MKRVVVTGASGFTGRALVRWLATAGYDVIAATRSLNDVIPFAGETVRGDLHAALEQIEGTIDGICHTAASVVLTGDAETRRRCFDDNVRATYEVTRFCERRSVPKLVYSSSISVYAPDTVITEESPVDPQTAYAASKLAGEWIVSSRVLKTKSVILRYSSIYGDGQRPNSVLPAFIRAVREGRNPTVHGSGKRSQDFVHVGDVCEANRLALGYDGVDLFNIGSGEETSMKNLARAVVAEFGGNAVDHVAVEQEDATRIRFDISKAKRLLGYSPRSLTEGLRTYGC